MANLSGESNNERHDPSQQIASSVAAGFGVLQCQEAADAIRQTLQAAGFNGQVIELRTVDPVNRPFIVLNNLPANAPAISQNGRHLGVRVGDLVFDNLHTNGIVYDEWMNAFDAVGGVHVHSVTPF